jgi:hypothetical protein
MSFFVRGRWGGSEREPTEQAMLAVLAELDADDPEHPDVALEHESGWALSAFPSGLAVFENVETDDEPRHLTGLSRADVADLWRLLAMGNLADLELQPWLPGYGSD